MNTIDIIRYSVTAVNPITAVRVSSTTSGGEFVGRELDQTSGGAVAVFHAQ